MTFDAHQEIIPADPKTLHQTVVAAGADGWELKVALPIMAALPPQMIGGVLTPTRAGQPVLVLEFQRPAGYQVEEAAEEMSGV